MAGQFLETLYLHDPDALNARIGQETLVICGAARGMTSVPAYVVHASGLPMGTKLGPGNFEDREFRDALPGSAGHQRRSRGPLATLLDPQRSGWEAFLATPEGRKLRRLIAARNATHDRWGFKLPRATEYVGLLRRECRRPVIVLCVRNGIATCRSVSTRDKSVTDPLQKLDQIADVLHAMRDLRDWGDPFIAIDMDAVRRNPAGFVDEFCDTLQLTVDRALIARELATPGYKKPAAPTGTAAA